MTRLFPTVGVGLGWPEADQQGQGVGQQPPGQPAGDQGYRGGGAGGAYGSQQQGQGQGQQGTGGGPGGAEERVGQQASGADEAVVVDAGFEALVARLPAECEVPLVFLCPITQVGDGARG